MESNISQFSGQILNLRPQVIWYHKVEHHTDAETLLSFIHTNISSKVFYMGDTFRSRYSYQSFRYIYIWPGEKLKKKFAFIL